MWQALSSGDEANDEGSGTSGSITSTSYTIQELESLTIYSVTVTVINDIGITVSQPIIISSMIVSTNTHYMSLHSLHPLLATQSDCQTDNTAAVTGGVVAVVFIVTTVAAVIVIVVLLLRNHRGHYSTGTQTRYNFMCFCFCESLEMVFLLYRGQMSAVDITTESNEAYELTKISGEPTYE